MKTVIAERVIHKGDSRIALRFPYDTELIVVVKGFSDARWSEQMKCWHIADRTDVITLLLNTFHGKAYIDYSALRVSLAEKLDVNHNASQKTLAKKVKDLYDSTLPALSEKGKHDIAQFSRWMDSNRFPASTVQTYTAMMVKFLRFNRPKEAAECTSDDLIRIVEEYILPNGLSFSFQNQMISAVKKFYSTVYKTVIDPGDIRRPRRQRRLPNVLSKDEVKRILSSVTNEKHRVMLSLLYACGLRRSELINLTLSDIERSRRLLRIRQSKGYKDRVVPVSDRTIEMIDTYMIHYKPQKFVFEGQWPGEPYSASSLEKVLKTACSRAGLGVEVTLHCLRHSYATHLLESGTSVRYIQELLGHSSSRTTEIYTHVTTTSIQKIRSPFDDL
jgi:integrase/recombinase XerD